MSVKDRDPKHTAHVSVPRRHALGAIGALTASLPISALPAATSAYGAVPWLESFSADDIAAAGSCTLIPEETSGPYPLYTIYDDPKFVRRDITEGRPGVALELSLKIVNVNNGCAPMDATQVYVWHTDKDGEYSGYVQPGGIDTRGETFMRGVQYTNVKGIARFTTVYPGWYPGRITHMHVQVRPTMGVVATTQIAFAQKVTMAVYDSPLYVARGQNTTVPDFASDGSFSDGVSHQKCSVTGSVAAGYKAKLVIGIAG